MRLFIPLSSEWLCVAPGIWRHSSGALAELGRLVLAVPAVRDEAIAAQALLCDGATGEASILSEDCSLVSTAGHPYRRLRVVIVLRDGRLCESRLFAIYRHHERFGVISIRSAGALPDEQRLLEALQQADVEAPATPLLVCDLLGEFSVEPPRLDLFSHYCD